VPAALSEALKANAEKMKAGGVTPGWPSSGGAKDGDLAYERGAMKRCGDVGIEVRIPCWEDVPRGADGRHRGAQSG
jgi:hypothetical protein